MRTRPRPARWRGFAGVGLLLAGLLLAAYLNLGPGPTARAGASTLVFLPRGSGVSEVSQVLKSSGVIRSERLFQVLARATGAGRSLKAGEYDIPSRTPVLSILSDLQAGRTLHRSVTLAEGRTSAMIVRQLQNTEWLSGDLEVPEEGVLLPETYRTDRGDSRQSLVDRMRSDQQALLDRLWAARQPGLPFSSPREAVILASIVEKETGQANERRRVAGVFINRLRVGMRLQSDPTVIYAISRGEPLGRTPMPIQACRRLPSPIRARPPWRPCWTLFRPRTSTSWLMAVAGMSLPVTWPGIMRMSRAGARSSAHGREAADGDAQWNDRFRAHRGRIWRLVLGCGGPVRQRTRPGCAISWPPGI